LNKSDLNEIFKGDKKMEMKINYHLEQQINQSINTWNESECKHYFIVEHPDWDSQNLYYDINYTFELRDVDGGYTEIFSMVKESDIREIVDWLKKKFNIPVCKYIKVMVDF
jgi:hypothetical protein